MIEKILIRIPREKKMLLQKEASARGLTMNALLLTILWDWLKANGDRPTAPAEERTKT